MNIFVLDESPILSAQWQHDRHVVKMILESAQMLSTACRLGRAPIDVTQSDVDRCYKLTHQNHPCNLWLRASAANFAWLTIHLDSLLGEYSRRFGKVHATYDLHRVFNAIVARYAGVERFWTRDYDGDRKHMIDPKIVRLASQHTPFAVCMPDEFKLADPIDSYRNLYIRSKIFQSHVKWTRCNLLPDFITRTQISDFSIVERVTLLVLENKNQQDSYREYGPMRQMPRATLVSPYIQQPANPKALTRFGKR